MDVTMTDTHIDITCTFEELVAMESLDRAIYATPDNTGHASQVYLASRPQFTYDFLLATTQDFDDAAGYDITAAWQEMDEASLAEHSDETYTITVPRTRQDCDA